MGTLRYTQCNCLNILLLQNVSETLTQPTTTINFSLSNNRRLRQAQPAVFRILRPALSITKDGHRQATLTGGFARITALKYRLLAQMAGFALAFAHNDRCNLRTFMRGSNYPLTSPLPFGERNLQIAFAMTFFGVLIRIKYRGCEPFWRGSG